MEWMESLGTLPEVQSLTSDDEVIVKYAISDLLKAHDSTLR